MSAQNINGILLLSFLLLEYSRTAIIKMYFLNALYLLCPSTGRNSYGPALMELMS